LVPDFDVVFVWSWNDAHEKAWDSVKKLISAAPVLAYYQPTEQLEIQSDSSQSGLGAALIQNGQPIAYASRALTETESRCAQIEEMLAVVVALEKFNDYTFGRKTIAHSDHKPLETILKKPIYRAPKGLQGIILRLPTFLWVRSRKGFIASDK
jgi:hypothetical protein